MFAVLLIAILIGASFWILRPFLLPIIWATMIVVATWPLMLAVQARLRRRALAVLVMSGTMLLIFVAPLLLAIQALVGNVDTIKQWTRTLATARIPPPPDWLSSIPLLGAKAFERWASIATAGTTDLTARLEPFVNNAARWLAGAFGSLGVLAIEFLLTVVIASIMYARGEAARAGVIRFGRRLAGDRGERVVMLAGQAIRAVALGVVVAALVKRFWLALGSPWQGSRSPVS